MLRILRRHGKLRGLRRHTLHRRHRAGPRLERTLPRKLARQVTHEVVSDW
jgi:hypothetical protein